MRYPDVITPHRLRRERKWLREAFVDIRGELATVRTLRASSFVLDVEDAEALLTSAYWKHDKIRRVLRWLRTVRIEKGSAWSPAAAARRCK